MLLVQVRFSADFKLHFGGRILEQSWITIAMVQNIPKLSRSFEPAKFFLAELSRLAEPIHYALWGGETQSQGKGLERGLKPREEGPPELDGHGFRLTRAGEFELPDADGSTVYKVFWSRDAVREEAVTHANMLDGVVEGFLRFL